MQILLSIHPRYINSIFSGEKKYEYRKTQFRQKVSSVVVYATTPVKKIVGEFTCEEILKDSPQNIWEQTKKFSGISQIDFVDYFEHSLFAYAIKIVQPVLYQKVKKLSDLNVLKAPQSFLYL